MQPELRQQKYSVREHQQQIEQNVTIPAEAVMKWVLDAVDCLLIIESLKEDSLMEDEVHSFLGVGDRKRRQGNLSARVILRKHTANTRICSHLAVVLRR